MLPYGDLEDRSIVEEILGGLNKNESANAYSDFANPASIDEKEGIASKKHKSNILRKK